jgi:hypothetical protein
MKQNLVPQRVGLLKILITWQSIIFDHESKIQNKGHINHNQSAATSQSQSLMIRRGDQLKHDQNPKTQTQKLANVILRCSSSHVDFEQNLQQGKNNCDFNRLAFKKAAQRQHSEAKGPTKHAGFSIFNLWSQTTCWLTSRHVSLFLVMLQGGESEKERIFYSYKQLQ